MGGTNARIAAAAVAACGTLSLVAPALAGAAGPLDDTARGVAPVSQEVDAIAQPAADRAVSIVRDAAKVPPPIEREMPAKGSDRGAAPASPVQAGPRSMHRAEPPGAVAPIARDSRPVRLHVSAETNRPSPPHGRKAMPPARSHRERAAGAGAGHGSQRVTGHPIGAPPEGPGLTGLARAPGAATDMIFTAFLLVALVTSLPFLLRRLRIPAPVVYRRAFAPLLEPPG